MDVQPVISIASVAFGAGGFLMGALVTRLLISDLRTTIANDRRADEKQMREWVEENFQRRHA